MPTDEDPQPAVAYSVTEYAMLSLSGINPGNQHPAARMMLACRSLFAPLIEYTTDSTLGGSS